jgi:hypothetical protein
MYSTTISPPYFGVYGTETRDPQQAIYQGNPTDVVLLPVTSPISTSLLTKSDPALTFSAWRATINEVAITDGMALFIIRAEEIGNPEYTENIKEIITYAKARGLTFTTPDIIVNHFNKIQNIEYSGKVDGDIGTITVKNNNDESVSHVTFKVVLPALRTGRYTATGGSIAREISGYNYRIIYVSTDIPARGTKEIRIEPAEARKPMTVNLPRQPIEGEMLISITDDTGKPLTGAEAIIDSKYYYPDKNGEITVDIKRGMHTITVQNPGYMTYHSTFKVKGRIFIILQYL